MDIFFGIALAVFGIVLIPIVAILAGVFAYVRAQRGRPVDINSGLTAYAVILLGAAAIVLTAGVASLLTAVMAEIDEDYTYGEFGRGGFPAFDNNDSFQPPDLEDNRQKEDVANGLALVATGVLAGAAHILLRAYLRDRGNFDPGVEGAWDVLMALIVGLALLVLIGTVFSETFERAIVDDNTNSPGDSIAAMWAFAVLWAVYAWRALRHLGGSLLGPRPPAETDPVMSAEV